MDKDHLLVCPKLDHTQLITKTVLGCQKTNGINPRSAIRQQQHTLQEYSKQAQSIHYNTFHKYNVTTCISVTITEAQCWLLYIWITISYFPLLRDTANLPPIHELPVLTLWRRSIFFKF
jgi:hypothetical protein